MQYYQLNDTDSVIAKSEKEALDKFKSIIGIVITNKYTEKEFKEEY